MKFCQSQTGKLHSTVTEHFWSKDFESAGIGFKGNFTTRLKKEAAATLQADPPWTGTETLEGPDTKGVSKTQISNYKPVLNCVDPPGKTSHFFRKLLPYLKLVGVGTSCKDWPSQRKSPPPFWPKRSWSLSLHCRIIIYFHGRSVVKSVKDKDKKQKVVMTWAQNPWTQHEHRTGRNKMVIKNEVIDCKVLNFLF